MFKCFFMQAKSLVYTIFFVWSCAFAYPDLLQNTVNLDHQGAIVVPSDLHDPHYLYVFSSTVNRLSIVDAFTLEVVKTVSLSSFVIDAVLSEDQQSIYFLTSQSNQWSQLDFSDSLTSPTITTHSAGLSGVSFESIEYLKVGDDHYIVLCDFSADMLYVFDLQDNGLVTQLDIMFQAVDTLAIAPRNQVLVLGDAGELEAYQVPSLQRLGNRVELSNYTSSNNFFKLSSETIGNSSYILVSNPISSASEILAIEADHQNFLLSVIDMDGISGNGITPIVLNTLMGSMYSKLTFRPESSADDQALYIYIEDISNGQIKVVDPHLQSFSTAWETVDNMTGFSNIASKGMYMNGSNDLYILRDVLDQVNHVSDQPTVGISNAAEMISDENPYTFNVLSNTSGQVKIKLMNNELSSVTPESVKTLSQKNITANQNKSISIDTDGFIEGNTLIGVYIDAGELSGRKGFFIFKDTVPPYPDDFKLKFGDEKIFITWDEVNQADIDYYAISFGTDPEASNGAGLTSPIQISHTGKGNYAYTLKNVENGIPVYVKIKTVDKQNNQSEYSPILIETPEQTIGLIALAGESGCQSQQGSTVIILLCLGSVLCLLKKVEYEN